MKTRLIHSLLAFCITTTALARIGETEAQIETRYGKPSERARTSKIKPEDPYKSALYNFGNLSIFVMFNQKTGLSECEDFIKEDGKTFSDNELALILKANANGKRWEYGGVTAIERKEWKLEDGSVFAIFFPFEKRLSLLSSAMSTFLNNQKKETEAKRLEGL